MQHYILPEEIKKGQTAGKRLASLKWPKSLHQKLIDMRYNVSFKAVAATPESVLPRTASLSIPLLNPKEMKEERAKFLKMLKWLFGITKGRQDLEKRLVLLMRIDAKNERERKKEIAGFRRQAQSYAKEAEGLMAACKGVNKKCGSKALGKWVGQKAAYKMFAKQADDLEKKLSDTNDKFDKAIDRMVKDIREFKSAETGLNKELEETMKLIKGVSGVMP